MNQPAYLSLDLDYWIYLSESPVEFLLQVLSFDQVTVVEHHHHLLPDIERAGKKEGVRHLINVDTHSDFPGACDGHFPHSKKRLHKKWMPSDLHFGEGTWAEFVKWREKGVFEWRRPPIKGGRNLGDCNGGICDPFQPEHQECTGWGFCFEEKGLQGIPWERVMRVGISVSPAYLELTEDFAQERRIRAIGALFLEKLGRSKKKTLSEETRKGISEKIRDYFWIPLSEPPKVQRPLNQISW